MKLGFRHIVPGGFAALALVLVLTTGCQTTPRAGAPLVRRGDEIMVAGQLFHTGTRVVLWTDPGGYDGYRVERRFAPLEKADWDSSHAAVKYLTTPNRYDRRRADLTEEEIEQVRGGGWDLPLLQRVVDQFVYHYDVCGTSRQCFKVLHDLRGLSVHFMLDLDGTIYQTVDLKERTWHATTSNTRSVGIEIANMGAYGNPAKSPLPEWYVRDADGRTRVTIPERFGDGGLLTKNFVGRPRLNEPVVGMVQGQQLTQYDFTPEQYAALVRLTATLCRVFPKITCDYPRDADGQFIARRLPDEMLANYNGLLGHLHIQSNKVDPGPAFDWDYIVAESRRLMGTRTVGTPGGSVRGNAAMQALFPAR
ncbi:MAG TPA: N-acetylmuramoyl-L-alanine amidase [Verrucomicrobiota bacterium]|jgi:N-acetyl-anhydromuramyl-L-alanine amidase AmpD|nr:N-acetylmuramoyl-L-alanine amidase [Verrucomicrobiota bacterium]OQB88188.1 MAG: N-acetyl-anhydromuranmyl-L-alanine amidase [Verrucomicrobia bacterium ADurb.Bin118]HPY29851.1 N-acetylmuramoyl-L-alanine amidase [Verrucomicrobiota bacterium]HQB16348.1 N-acetylmuramoyl-L-alanine amidase [Verrucomicrobiota bacterium]